MKWRTLFARLGVRREKTLSDRLARRAADSRQKARRNQAGYTPYVLVVSHDAYPAGAQRLLLNLLGEWRRRNPFAVKVICSQDGALRHEFEALYPTLVLSDFPTVESREDALVEFCAETPHVIYSSTVVNGVLIESLRALDAPIISHCHELQASIERWAAGSTMTGTLFNSDAVLSGCDAVARNLRLRHQVPAERSAVVWDFIDPWRADRLPTANDVTSLCRELSIAAEDIVIFGCGTTDWRKGPDLFVDVAVRSCLANSRLKFVWIGGEVSPQRLQETIATNGLSERIRFIGDRPLSRRYYYAGHIFALTSREDPCPLAALEAADAKLPVVCFADAGDIPVALGPECGAVVDFENVEAFATAILSLAHDEKRRAACGQHGFDRVEARHTTQAAARAIE